MPTTVRISEHGRDLLAELARDADTSMTEVLDAALEHYRRQRFLERASAAYARLAADAVEAQEYRADLAALDGTLSDGLQGEAP